ncbi:site-specific integrase [Pedobacter duraquae]|uniref:Integrase-like protein n=1 Tax=Pedobacter duraquae TaxID=425511 RepID=A0A4R6IJ34_9SPHI|nr:site-specific integrase [Pedobacter duraquae]TDO21936.1 integrase-like protein [Pedobacter duraquae]
MAKLTPVILNAATKEGTWTAKIRVGHKGESKYIDTRQTVTTKDVDKSGSLKASFIVKNLSGILNRYEEELNRRSTEIKSMTAEEVKTLLLNIDTPSEQEQEDEQNLYFLAFCKNYIDELKATGRAATAKTMETVYFSLQDYLNRQDIPTTAITSKFLKDFENYLRSPRIGLRMNQNEMREKKFKPLEDRGVHNRMRDFRIMFNKAKELYNDEEYGEIAVPNNPYKKYKVIAAPESEQRVLEISQVIKIRDLELKPGGRMEMARDLFMLSFYLCGMNAADLYRLEGSGGKRIEYNRKKTESRRRDKAFISVSIIEQAAPLYDKYAGVLQRQYLSHGNLDRAINYGLKKIGSLPEINIPKLGFYYARYTFADAARNICKFHTEDVGRALNHKDNTNKTTDIYIRKDWSIIDEIQQKVTALLYLPG